MSKRKQPPPQRPADEADAFLARVRVIDLSRQGEALTKLFNDLAAKNHSDAIKVSAELRQLARDLSEEVFQSGLVLSSGAVGEFAKQFVELVRAMLTPQTLIFASLDAIRERIDKLPRHALSEPDWHSVMECKKLLEAVADEGASPILDIEFALDDLLRETKNDPSQTWEGLKRTWAKLSRLKPEGK